MRRIAKLGHASKLMTRYYTNTSLEEMLGAVGKVEDTKKKAPDAQFPRPAPTAPTNCGHHPSSGRCDRRQNDTRPRFLARTLFLAVL